MLLEFGIFLMLLVALGFSLVEGRIALFVLLLAVCFYLAKVPLEHQLNAVFIVMMFDLQRLIAGNWVYIDLLFITLLVPLIQQRIVPSRWWVFVPYTVFLLVDGLPRALVPAWYAGFALRSCLAVLVYLGCAVVAVEESFYTILGLSMIVLSVYGVYQLILGDFGPLFEWLNPHMDMPWTGRAYSLLWQPNSFGGVCSIAIVSFAALAFSGIRKRQMMVYLLFTFVGLLSSGSRGALIATFGGIFLAAWISRKKRLIAIPIIAAMLIFIAGNLFQVTFLQRLGQGDRESNEGRALGNYLGLRSFYEHPLIGVGPTNFEAILPTMHEWGYPNAMPVNNIYLQHLAELGILGFAAFWVPVCSFAWTSWRWRRDPIVLAGLCSMLVFAIHGLFDYLWEFGPPYLYLFYASCGILSGRVAHLEASNITAWPSPVLSSPTEASIQFSR